MSNEIKNLAQALEALEKLEKHADPELGAKLEKAEARIQAVDADLRQAQAAAAAAESRVAELEQERSALISEAKLSETDVRAAARANLYESAFQEFGLKVDPAAPAQAAVTAFRARCKLLASAEALQIVASQGADYPLPVSGEQPGAETFSNGKPTTAAAAWLSQMERQ